MGMATASSSAVIRLLTLRTHPNYGLTTAAPLISSRCTAASA
jgi:hypothetical protein